MVRKDPYFGCVLPVELDAETSASIKALIRPGFQYILVATNQHYARLCDVKSLAPELQYLTNVISSALRASPFRCLVGENKECFNIPSTLAKDISEPLYSLMNNEQMKEAQARVAEFKEVDCDTFTAFCEYAYTDEYRVPKVTVDLDPPDGTGNGAGPHLRDQVEEDTGGFFWARKSTSKTKKVRSNKKSEESSWQSLEKDQDLEPTESLEPAEQHTLNLWNQFCSLKYDNALPENNHMEGRNKIEFKPVLFHCKVYVFAQMYLIAALKQLALRKLHGTLKETDFDAETHEDLLEALGFAFQNTARPDNNRDEDLRKLLVSYTASKIRLLKKDPDFRALLDQNGELGSELVCAIG